MKGDELLMKFPWAVSFTKCENCGRSAPVSAKLAQMLIGIMGDMGNLPEIVLEKKEDYKKYYFVTGYCMYCATDLTEQRRVKNLKIEIKTVEKEIK